MTRDVLHAAHAIVRSLAKAPVLLLGALIGFGFVIPRRHGLDFFDIRMVLAYAFIPMLFVAPAIAGLVGIGVNRISSVRRLYAGLVATSLYGWAMALLFLAAGFGTVNLTLSPEQMALPPVSILKTYAVFSAAAVVFVASISAYCALLFSPGAARNVLRVGFLTLLLLFYGGSTLLPLSWQVALNSEMTTSGYQRVAMLASVILALFSAGLLNALRVPFESISSKTPVSKTPPASKRSPGGVSLAADSTGLD